MGSGTGVHEADELTRLSSAQRVELRAAVIKALRSGEITRLLTDAKAESRRAILQSDPTLLEHFMRMNNDIREEVKRLVREDLGRLDIEPEL